MYIFKPLYVITFNSTNEVQHVPSTWLSKNSCWFLYIQSDNKNIYFTVPQVANMIKKCTLPNKNDGKNYNVVIRAGPFGKQKNKLNK